MKSSNQDKAEGTFHEVKGKIKEVAGKLSDNPKLATEGIETVALPAPLWFDDFN